MMMKVVYAIACIVLVGAIDGQAAVCVTKSKKGTIKKVTIRESCAKKETSVPSSQLLQQGPHVIDSGGKEVGTYVDGDQVLRQIGSQFVRFSVNKKGVVTPVSDAQYGFTYQGNQCSGNPFNGDLDSVDDDALTVRVSESADGKTGYYIMSSERTMLSGPISQVSFTVQCTTPPDPPVTATCPGGETPLGAAASCDPKKLFRDPDAQCSCISCCSTFTVTPPSTYRANPVHTVDLSGVGTPPFTIER